MIPPHLAKKVEQYRANVAQAENYKQHVIDNWKQIDHNHKSAHQWIDYYNKIIDTNNRAIKSIEARYAPKVNTRHIFTYVAIIATIFFGYIMMPFDPLTGLTVSDEDAIVVSQGLLDDLYRQLALARNYVTSNGTVISIQGDNKLLKEFQNVQHVFELSGDIYNLSVWHNSSGLVDIANDAKVIYRDGIIKIAAFNKMREQEIVDNISTPAIAYVLVKGYDGEQILIDYLTEMPYVEEKIVAKNKKKIILGDLNESVTIRAKLPMEAKKQNVNVKRTDQAGEVENVTYFDTDGNGLYDTVEFDSSESSEYEVSITILNVQSYPIVGGEWEVRFETEGTADLIIAADNGTTWSESGSSDDLNLIEVRCGGVSLDYEWVGGSIVIPDYYCNSTGRERSTVLTEGKHTIMFQYGDQVMYAYNNATNAPVINSLELNATTIENSTADNLTAYVNATDVEVSNVKVIYNWIVDNETISPLIMPFEGGSNSTFTRDYASGTNGTVNGPTWNKTYGHDGFGAYSFDGVDDEINVDYNNLVRSVLFWFKPAITYDTESAVIISDDDFTIEIDNGQMVFNYSGDVVYSTTNQFDADTYYHIGATNDARELRLYVNGSLQNSTNVTAAFIVQNDSLADVASFYNNGDIVLAGACFTTSCSDPGSAPFVIANSTGNTSFVSQAGGLCITDTDCNDMDLSCDGFNDGSFIIQDEVGRNVSYIDANGNLCTTGSLYENN